MTLRKIPLALLALIGLPAVSPAGPIEFGYATGNITTSPWAPELAMTLQGYQPPGPVFTFDPAGGRAVTLPAVSAVPQLLPAPSPRDVHPDGTTHWNNDGYFGVDVGLYDFASGQSATLHFGGRAHMYNAYSVAGGWTGSTVFWFNDVQRVTLGGNEYTVWGANQFSDGPASVNVWVGADPPLNLTPEPGTLALAALGLAPLALRSLRRRATASA
jgi:hypothetical protein